MTYEKPLAQYRILLILAELDEGPKSAREIAEAVGMCKTAVPGYLSHMGARVAAWRKPVTGNLVPLYDMQPLPDARRPKPMSEIVRKRLQWQRVKADPARHERVKALQRIRRRGVAGVTLVINGRRHVSPAAV